MTHNIKLLDTFADDVFTERKPFEVRKDDRGYKEGDTVRFKVIDAKGNHVKHPIESYLWEITYVLQSWGLREGYVAFGIKKVEL